MYPSSKKSIFLKFFKMLESMILRGGAEGRNRTDTGLPPPDFHSLSQDNGRIHLKIDFAL